jgi:hypothetical protein
MPRAFEALTNLKPSCTFAPFVVALLGTKGSSASAILSRELLLSVDSVKNGTDHVIGVLDSHR